MLTGPLTKTLNAETGIVGTWSIADTSYVFTINIPARPTLTSMKIQRMNLKGRYVTTGSPRIEIIPPEFIGNHLSFRRSRQTIDADVQPAPGAPQFRIAYFDAGLSFFQYGLLKKAPPKPVTTADAMTKIDTLGHDFKKPPPLPFKTSVGSSPIQKARTLTASVKDSLPKPHLVRTETDTCDYDGDSTSTRASLDNQILINKSGKTDSTRAESKSASPEGEKPVTKGVGIKPKRPPIRVVARQPSKAPKGTIFNEGILNGLVLEASIASPYWVSKNLTTWYSSMDWRFSFTTPFYYHWGPVMIGFTLEWSSYDFENTFPEGGRFQGQAILGYVTGYWRGLNVELGGGKFRDTAGAIAGLSGKILEGNHLYLAGGIRGVVIQNIQTIGQGHWADGRLTVGYKF